MKRALLAISASLGLAFVATPAFAQDTALISQHGNGGSVMIEQVAGMGTNRISVYQSEGWDGWSSGSVQVNQSQVADSIATVFQSGNNQINVFQHDGAYLNVEVNDGNYGPYYGGEFNSVTVDQSGFDAWARVDQFASAYSNANITQASNGGLMAELFQHGNYNQANIFQAGGNLNATIHQGGENNTASIHQRNY
jgi:hypothetical protein